MDEMTKISVIIPVYNVEKYLRQCLDSVINQTLREIEIICVDDGSSDGSLQILNEYAKQDKRIKILQQKNEGAGAARNAGLKVAQGKYLSFLDSDDFFEPNMLKEMYTKAERDGADITTCGYYKYDQSKGKDAYTRDIDASFCMHSPINPAQWSDDLFSICYPAPWNKIISRDLFVKYNLQFEKFKSCNDFTCVLTAIALASKISCVGKHFVHYRWNTGSQTSTNRFGKDYLIHAIAALENNLRKFGLYEKFYGKMLYIALRSLSFETQDNINVLKKSAKKYLSSRLYKDLYNAKRWKEMKMQNADKHFYTVKLFFFLPIYGWKKVGGRTVWKILGVPFLKRRCMENGITKKYYIFGVPFIKISDKHKGSTVQPTVNANPVEDFIHHEIRPNSVLLLEANNFHGECLVGAAKYFEKAGYNIDVCLSDSEYRMNPFIDFNSDKVRLFALNKEAMRQVLCHDIIEKYEHVYLNSDYVYYELSEHKIFDFIGPDIKFPEGRYITMCHYADRYDQIAPQSEKFAVVALNKLPALENKNYSLLNTHYFGDFERVGKNKKVNFICIGQIESKRKNHSLLFDAIDELLKKNITNFKVTVVARIGNLEIPAHIAPYLNFKGRLNYGDMYEELKKADFYMTLFDPENPLHQRYLVSGSSGSYQLIYGFKLPCLIPHKFQTQVNGFNAENSIGYAANEDLAKAMESAINMSDKDYMAKVKKLTSLADALESESLQNLQNILRAPDNRYAQNYFISLGENCFNRTVLTRHHLKCRREQGELSYPFDLCVCSVNAALQVIQNDFADYFDDLYWNKRDHIWCNKKYGIRYNHDEDCAETDKDKLVSRYSKRIDNFRKMLSDKQPHAFIFSTVNAGIDAHKVCELRRELCQKTGQQISLLFADLSKEGIKTANLSSEGVIYKHIPHPYPNYWGEWYKYEYFNSPEGREFEKSYIDFIEKNLEQPLKKVA